MAILRRKLKKQQEEAFLQESRSMEEENALQLQIDELEAFDVTIEDVRIARANMGFAIYEAAARPVAEKLEELQRQSLSILSRNSNAGG
jgi:hypothetical protein